MQGWWVGFSSSNLRAKAQGVALAARHLGTRAIIVMPVTTPQVKVDAVISRGGEVVLYGDT